MAKIVRRVAFALYAVSLLLITIAGMHAASYLPTWLPLEDGDLPRFLLQIIGVIVILGMGALPLTLIRRTWQSSAAWPHLLLGIFSTAAALTFGSVGSAFFAVVFELSESQYDPREFAAWLGLAMLFWVAFALKLFVWSWQKDRDSELVAD